MGVCSCEKAGTRSLVLRVFYLFPKAEILGKASGKNLNRIFISFPFVPFQGRGLLIRCHHGWGCLINVAGPDVSHGITSSGFVAFLGLELKHN